MAEAALLGGAAHHSFHVFAVDPWLALLRAGKDGGPLRVLDKCRVRWGKVLSVDGDTVTVLDRPLSIEARLLVEGPERVEVVQRSLGGVGFVPALAPGDSVALHWDWVCQQLTSEALDRLCAWTGRMLGVVNSLSVPEAVVAAKAGARVRMPLLRTAGAGVEPRPPGTERAKHSAR